MARIRVARASPYRGRVGAVGVVPHDFRGCWSREDPHIAKEHSETRGMRVILLASPDMCPVPGTDRHSCCP